MTAFGSPLPLLSLLAITSLSIPYVVSALQINDPQLINATIETNSSALDVSLSSAVLRNCTKLELICRTTSNSSSNLNIWWTLNGQNMSRTSDVIESYTFADSGNQSKLTVECALLGLHDGLYVCNAQPINESELMLRKQTNVKIIVPLEISSNAVNGVVSQNLESKTRLICKVNAFPKTTIKWEKRVGNESLAIEDDGRIVTEMSEVNETAQQSVLSIESLKRSDNGSYVCRASNHYNTSITPIDLIVYETPEIDFERIQVQSPREVTLHWTLAYSGNSEVHRIEMQFKNYSSPEMDTPWLTLSDNVGTNGSQFTVTDLIPGSNYGFRLAAINSLGRSDWETMNTTLPPDVPSKVSEMHVLAKTNETLLIGFKRPTHDNGGQISQYHMILTDANDRLISNQTLDILATPALQSRNNYMIMFRNLTAGSYYKFKVRSLSDIGYSLWSDILDAVTADGHSDPPRNVKLKCLYDIDSGVNNGTVMWTSPDNSRGSIVGYNISLEAFSSYRNAENRLVIDQFKEAFEVSGNQTFIHHIVLKPNTNYTVRVCTINKSGCGQLSHITGSTMCESSATTPSSLPSKLRLEKVKFENNSDQTSRLLRVFVPRISERNGPIRCYKVIIIRLPNHSNASEVLPSSPAQLNVTTYSLAHTITTTKSQDSVHNSIPMTAYVAEEFSSDNLVNNVVIGDGYSSYCLHDFDNRSPRRISFENESALSLSANNIFDGTLLPHTNYTGYIEVTVLGPNSTLMTKQSDYFEPIETSANDLIAPLSKTSFTLFFSSMSDSANGILFGTICGLFLVLVLLSSVLCFLKRKANETSASEDERMGLTSLIRRTVGRHRNGHIPNNLNLNSVNAIHKWVSVPIPVHSITAVFQERHANSDFFFQAEFEALPEKFSDRTTVASDSPENLSKNRYPDIKSYDQTRVKLSKIDGIPGSDYINADYVEGYRKRKTFICAQGPIEKTVADFWRLVYEQKCRIIVMLTGIEEQGRIKCSQYWSDDKTKQISDLFQVTLKSVRKYSDYVIRRFNLEKLDGSSESRDILHFHFVMWRDFLAPEQPSWLLRFIKRVNEHYCPDMGPIVVHCSAGVGRTGTFIAIDTLMAQINDNSSHINIFDCVSHLRHQRNHLVQSLKQYIFVYRAVMEFAEFGDTEIEICHLRDHYRLLKDHKFEGNINGIMVEFEKLNEVIEDQKTCVVGSMDVNKVKNRYDFIIPYDMNRVILTPLPSKDNSYYINASFIQGYDHFLSFIVTQDPMENTVNEFWWTITEQNVSTLVMLAELGDSQSKCHCYWTTDEFDCEFVRVKFVEELVSQFYIKRVFDVTHKKTNECQRVSQFQFLSWKSGVVPDSATALINLVDACLANNSQSSSPILVHCSGGGDRSSVFVAFASLIRQIKCEERVDVFQTCRYTRSQRQCMLQTIAQFDFLYRSLIEYIESHKLCDSGDTQL